MKKLRTITLSVLSILTMTSCASIVTGTNQSVSVNTGATYGARCTLSNNKGTWYVSNTPGSVVVHRSFDDLVVNCNKKNIAGHKTVKSTTKGMAFGNVVFGGVIGAGVDVANGAAYDYPTDIFVAMHNGTTV